MGLGAGAELAAGWRGWRNGAGATGGGAVVGWIRRPGRAPRGEMSEWLKEHAWKACVGVILLPWVRIPLSPPLAFCKSLKIKWLANFLGDNPAFNPPFSCAVPADVQSRARTKPDPGPRRDRAPETRFGGRRPRRLRPVRVGLRPNARRPASDLPDTQALTAEGTSCPTRGGCRAAIAGPGRSGRRSGGARPHWFGGFAMR